MANEDLTAEEAQEEEAESGPSVTPSYIQDTGPLMILSLFLLLLAFFILLVTMSTINNQKKVAVFNSVSSAFRVDRERQRVLNVRINNVGDYQNNDIFDELKSLWLSLIQISAIDFPKTGSYMEISLHSNEIFEPGTTNLRVKALNIVRRMVTAMKNPTDGFRAQITFNLKNILDVDIETALKQHFDGVDTVVEFQETGLNKDILDPRLYFDDIQRDRTRSIIVETNRDTLQYMRALNFAYTMENAGATPRLMLIGVQEDVSDTILIRLERFRKD